MSETERLFVRAQTRLKRHHFGLPAMLGGKILSIVPWSRILSDSEIVVAINTDPDAENTAWVTIDAGLHKEGESLTCIYSSDAKQIARRRWSRLGMERR